MISEEVKKNGPAEFHMKTGFQRWIGVIVAYSLFLCSIYISCIASESATKATASENRHPITDKKPADSLLEKSFDNDDEAIDAYRKVIELHPGRAIAYLKLGDTLRNQLSKVDSFEEKIELTKEIKAAHLQYKKLRGKSTPAIDSFLALNVVDTPITDFCEYVATYANEERLEELFALGGSVLKADKSGTMLANIIYQGSAGIPWVSLTDDSTDEEMSDDERKNDIAEENNGDRIALIPFSDGHHLLYYNHGGYLHCSAPIGAALQEGKTCHFSVHVTEFFDKKSADREVCNRVTSSEPLPYIPFDGPHSITDEVIQDAGFSQTSLRKAGTVDFDNDGKDEVLVELEYASGAGAGCAYNFFDLLNEERNGFSDSKKRQLLYELQGINKYDFHPVPFCEGNTTGWFRYKGITYYETKYPGKQPEDQGQEFHTVSYIKDGKIHKVCDARFKVRIETEPDRR